MHRRTTTNLEMRQIQSRSAIRTIAWILQRQSRRVWRLYLCSHQNWVPRVLVRITLLKISRGAFQDRVATSTRVIRNIIVSSTDNQGKGITRNAHANSPLVRFHHNIKLDSFILSQLVDICANRVGEIRLAKTSDWRHVPSRENPADILSRGLYPYELVPSNMWWSRFLTIKWGSPAMRKLRSMVKWYARTKESSHNYRLVGSMRSQYAVNQVFKFWQNL